LYILVKYSEQDIKYTQKPYPLTAINSIIW